MKSIIANPIDIQPSLSRHFVVSLLRRPRVSGVLAALLALWPLAARAATYTHVPTPYAWIDPSAHTPVTWSNPTQCTGFGDTIGPETRVRRSGGTTTCREREG
jgi:hypothetical protein